MTRLFEKEYGLPVNATPPIREAGLEPSVWPPSVLRDHRFTSAQIALLEQVRWSNAYAQRAFFVMVWLVLVPAL